MLGLLLVGLVLLSACGGSSGSSTVDSQSTTAADPTASSTTASSVSTLTATSSPQQAAIPGAMKVGETAHLDGGVTIQVLAANFPGTPAHINSANDPDGLAVELRWCAGPALPPGGLTVGGLLSTAVQTDDDAISYSATGDSPPSPQFGRTTLAPNQCVQGWQLLAVTAGRTPVRVMVYPKGVDQPIVWELGTLTPGPNATPTP